MEVARCEVTQLAQSRQYPTIAGIIKPFVPKNVYDRYLVYYMSKTNIHSGHIVHHLFPNNMGTNTF